MLFLPTLEVAILTLISSVMQDPKRLRELLLEQLKGRNAHIDFEQAVEGLRLEEVGIRPEGLPHSIWELVEHIRISQHDIVAFSQNPDYASPDWPEGYWPESKEPASRDEWERSVEAIREDHIEMVRMVKDKDIDLLKPFEHGDGQTLFREAMLIVDHGAYHIGQIVDARRLLDCW